MPKRTKFKAGSEEKILPIGKLRMDLLENLLQKYCIHDERLVVAPRVGEDAAAIDFFDRYVVVKTDPITFATDAIGWYVIHVNANDLATMGACPKWFLVTVLLPEGKTTFGEVEEIFSSIARAAEPLGIAIAGGHTEVTAGLERPIVVGQMLGEVKKDKLILTSGARPGDDLLLTKGLAIEATSIIAREKEEELKKRYSEDFISRCKNFLYSPGISIVKEALLANENVTVHSMHDPTEGGLASGIYEIAHAAKVGVWVEGGNINIFPETEILCRHFGLDPLGIIASGALLLTVPPEESKKVIPILKKEGIECQRIGEIKDVSMGIKLITDDNIKDFSFFDQDEITKVFRKN